MGLMFRRRPRMRLGAGAATATATVAYNAGKRHEQQGHADELVWGPDAATQAPEPPPTAAAPGAPDTAASIERLASLHTSGALTDDEFAAAKAKLLVDVPSSGVTRGVHR